MKIVIYHYVRESVKNLPNFRYLHIENFRRQLDFFAKEFGFVSYDEFCYLKENPLFCKHLKNKILLTFDDGLKDHYHYVLNELIKRKLFGIFFIPTRIFRQNKALDVHRVHYLLGKMGGGVLDFTQKLIKTHMLKKSSLKLFKNYYEELDDDKNTKEFKLLFNYFIKPSYREGILDQIVSHFCSDEEIFYNLYLNEDELRIMNENGMMIASHSLRHISFKNLNIKEQKNELSSSTYFLENMLGKEKVKIFSYPYGENTAYAKRWLKKYGFDFAFCSIPSKDISSKDLINNPFSLHRYDCNEFVYGKASYG